MTKAEFVNRVHEFGETQSRAHAERVVNAVFEVLAESLEKKEEVKVAGFGRFFTQDKPARQARNPQTGDVVEVEAKTVVKFKPASALVTRVKATKVAAK